MAELDDGTFIFSECKWRTERVTRLNDLSILQAKVASLPEARWRNKARYILFALGGFSPELQQLGADPAERLSLVTNTDMLTLIIERSQDAVRHGEHRSTSLPFGLCLISFDCAPIIHSQTATVNRFLFPSQYQANYTRRGRRGKS
jgi:hypothetical protein